MIDIELQNENNLFKEFCKYFYSKQKYTSDIKYLYIQYYSLSKKNGINWSNDFRNNLCSFLIKKEIPKNIINYINLSLEFKLLINDNILLNIKEIINGNIIELKDYKYISINLNLDLKFNYYIHVCNSFLVSKLYTLFKVYSLQNKDNKKFTNFEVLFNEINKCSLNGNFIYKSNNKYIFKINTSKYSDFFLRLNRKTIAIYDSISEKEDIQNTLLNFIHVNSVHSEDIKIVKEKIKKLEITSKENFLNKISEKDIIDYYLIKESIGKEVNFIFNFNYKLIDYYFNQNDIFCIYLKHITDNELYGKKININLSNLFIKEMALQHNINIIDNEYIESITMKIISTIKNYDNLIVNTNFSFNNNNIIKKLILNILLKLFNEIKREHSNEYTIKNLMYQIGLFDKKNRDEFYKIISDINTINIKDIDKIFKDDFKWISYLIKNLNFEMIISEIKDMKKLNIKDEIILKKILSKSKNYNIREIKNIINNNKY